MKAAKYLALSILCTLFCATCAFAKADTVDLFTNSVMTGDAATLENILAPNFWYVGANGHIQDKEHFIQEIRDKQLIVNRLSLSNMRETKVGDTRLLTSNGTFSGKSPKPLPEGLMRFTMVLADNNGKEEVALFQATPVIATPDCHDGNCRIK